MIPYIPQGEPVTPEWELHGFLELVRALALKNKVPELIAELQGSYCAEVLAKTKNLPSMRGK